MKYIHLQNLHFQNLHFHVQLVLIYRVLEVATSVSDSINESAQVEGVCVGERDGWSGHASYLRFRLGLSRTGNYVTLYESHCEKT